MSEVRLIDANELIKKVEFLRSDSWSKQAMPENQSWADIYELFLSLLEEAPVFENSAKNK